MKIFALVKQPIFPILLVNFVGALGYGIILPFLAFLVIDFGGNEVLYGLIAASYPLFQMVGAPLLGNWSDKIGRKKVLLISQAGTLFSWLIFLAAFMVPVQTLIAIPIKNLGTFTLTFPLLIVILSRSLDGLTGGNISVANAYLSDITPEEDRSKNFGLMSSSMSLGFIIGPAIAGLLASFEQGNLITIIITAIIAAAGLIAIYYLLPDVPLQESVYPCEEAKIKKTLGFEYRECYELENERGNSFISILSQPRALFMVLLFFLIFLAFNLFYATFSMYSSTTLQWSAQKVGFFFTALSGVMILGQGPVLSKLSSRYSEFQLFLAGSLTMALTFALLTSRSDLMLFLGATLYGLGNGIMWPSYLAILSKTGTPDKQGGLQGIANGTGSLAGIIGLSIGGILLALLAEKIYFISTTILVIIFILGSLNLRTTSSVTGPSLK